MLTKDNVLDLIEQLDSDRSIEGQEMLLTSDDKNRSFTLIEDDSDGWDSDDDKYQTNYYIFRLCEMINGKHEPTDYLIGQGVTRTGSYYSHYEFTYESPELVKKVEVVERITKYVPLDKKDSKYLEDVRCPKCDGTNYSTDFYGEDFVGEYSASSSKYYTCKCGTKFKVINNMSTTSRVIETEEGSAW